MNFQYIFSNYEKLKSFVETFTPVLPQTGRIGNESRHTDEKRISKIDKFRRRDSTARKWANSPTNVVFLRDTHTPGLLFRDGVNFGMDRNFVCLWSRHNCRSQVMDLSRSALISWFMKSIIGFLNNSNFHAIIATSLIIYLQWVNKFI
jgi:hypothetical protein